MDFLEVKGLRKEFKEIVAVDNVSFSVMTGEVFGLLGPNGAGKSTTISMLCGLLTPNAGSIYLKGEEVTRKPSEVKRVLGLVPQDVALYPSLTARENLTFWGRMYGLSGSLLSERVNEALEYCGLTDRAGDRIETFSGGMKRRINIGAALLHKPELLIMDEPTVGIDPQSRNHSLDTVLRLNSEGVTVIYTSHYMEEVEQLCSRIAIMDYGKVIAMGTKDELAKTVGDADKLEIAVGESVVPALKEIEAIPGVQSVADGSGLVTVLVKGGHERLPQILEVLSRSGAKIRSVNITEPNLESVFLSLTGRALRD
jgi:ABC-2 type transport system ATP-binding protein